MNKKERTQAFITHFSKNMPEAKTELDYTNVFELTVAVVLSAQCTDKRVNIITKNLFKLLPTAEVMAEASIDVIEIGFRSPPKQSFMGPFVYSLDDYLETLPLPKKILIGVMINAKEYLNSPEDPVELINKLFQSAEKSPVGLVRIAINFEQALEGEVLAGRLKELGYRVGLNMMQSHGKEQYQYQQTAKNIAEGANIFRGYFGVFWEI